ncbi:hypothetical protein CEK28_03855 [Xenophilus sp. AP218F]|nr:hypothetical protein CEK28_03855 [Xenophilus sp. AP218F]
MNNIPRHLSQPNGWVQVAESELNRYCLSGEFYISRPALDTLSDGFSMVDLLNWFNIPTRPVITGDTRLINEQLQAHFGFDPDKPNRLCFFVEIDLIHQHA